MVVKSQIKFIKSLHQKKYRNEHKMFIVEGLKTVAELLKSDFKLQNLYITDEVQSFATNENTHSISKEELKKISGLKTPSGVLGVFQIPQNRELIYEDWIVALDRIQDPGNLGTIIRLCDWFGIKQLLCTKDTVDCYNPKVLQATMGSISRVNVIYDDLQSVLENAPIPIYGTFMDGISVYSVNWPSAGILVLGNEANGISNTLEQIIHRKIGIPQFGEKTTESLNVATASAILLNEIRRSQ